MNIIDVVKGIDLDLLTEQGNLVEETIARLQEEQKEFADPENIERCKHDIELFNGLLELIDSLAVVLEDV